MFYELGEELNAIEVKNLKEDVLTFGTCTTQELKRWNEDVFHFSSSTIDEVENKSNTRMANKLDSYYGYCFGILHVLEKTQGHFSKTKISIYFKANLVLLVCDEEKYEKRMFDIIDKLNPSTRYLEHIISAILEGITYGNLELLENIELKIEHLDEQVILNKVVDFNQELSHLRKDILLLTHYYGQLLGFCEELLEDENNFFDEQHYHHIRIYTDRTNRLYNNVRLLRDYTVQIREVYQSQVDINLNQIMYVFTVVTTIFLPLTLIVGWYGMNFTTMPELAWQYGYLFVILLSLAVIIGCLWFFKKKRLLKK